VGLDRSVLFRSLYGFPKDNSGLLVKEYLMNFVHTYILQCETAPSMMHMSVLHHDVAVLFSLLLRSTEDDDFAEEENGSRFFFLLLFFVCGFVLIGCFPFRCGFTLIGCFRFRFGFVLIGFLEEGFRPRTIIRSIEELMDKQLADMCFSFWKVQKKSNRIFFGLIQGKLPPDVVVMCLDVFVKGVLLDGVLEPLSLTKTRTRLVDLFCTFAHFFSSFCCGFTMFGFFPRK